MKLVSSSKKPYKWLRKKVIKDPTYLLLKTKITVPFHLTKSTIGSYDYTDCIIGGVEALQEEYPEYVDYIREHKHSIARQVENDLLYNTDYVWYYLVGDNYKA